MRLGRGLMRHINQDKELETRLSMPLRKTVIHADTEINPEMLPRGGALPPRQLSKSNDADWNAGWEIRDSIIEKKE
jgi:hypothetical protein